MKKSVDAGNGSHKAKRAERFTSETTLREAVRARCLAEVDALMGGAGAGEEVEALARAEIAEATETHARNVWRALMGALADAHDLMQANPSGPWKSYAAKLAMLFYPDRFAPKLPESAGWPVQIAARRARQRLAEDDALPAIEDLRSRRALIVEMYKGSHLWWHERAPKPRDIALITLLLGELPSGVSPSERRPYTVAEVLKLETNAVRSALAESNRRHERWIAAMAAANAGRRIEGTH